MRSKFSWAAFAIVVFGVFLASVATPVGATSASATTITVKSVDNNDGTFSQSFVATGGVICGTGIAYDTHLAISGTDSLQNIRVDKLLICDDGSGTITLQLAVQGTDQNGSYAESGRWIVSDGTGAYARLRGTGTEVWQGNDSFVANTGDWRWENVLTGNVRLG